ncbi:SDR family oxidoreductase [Aquisalimonas asiatica]|uniref:NADP-dependent 3-hydroxy acid dehydrogenase YdfG n=1 Tax=Aquisalimonas asiatica TaxID=406100 RepID=A0A1H8UWP7_9GAMM|nr:SDR family oxidoreductase [Aquisalimonas asiatica]SEP07423.1 NADP-dependent 3-hydroxy acid dehydrogenase YdfG [Aquisalimonas asiatica]
MTGTVLITGGTSGFGAATARRFRDNGWKVVITGRRGDRLAAMQQELGGPEYLHTLQFDITDRQATEQALASLPPAFAEVDVLVNNAGLALGREPAQECSMDEWETMVETNIMGVLRLTRALLPGMVERNRGHVINLGSVAGNWPYPGGNVYCGTKAFVQQFSRAVRSDLQGTRVRVTNLEPGLCETEFSTVRFRGDSDKAASLYEGNDPIQPEDIAEVIWWVTSLPARVNVNTLEVMPVTQSWNPLAVKPVA